jgi:hypothetical protein
VKPRSPSYVKAALLMPANLFALAAGGVASVALGDWLPLAAAGGAAGLYLALLSTMPSFRRTVRARAAELDDVASPDELASLLADLAPSQRQHYQELAALKQRILESYRKMPGGRVLVASSERRLEGLLTSFLRLVATLNSYRRFLSATDRQAIERELALLEREVADEKNERLRDVKARRVEILKKRVQRFVQAEESRELVSHQLAGIEDVLRLTHEQSIAIRDPEVVSRQLEALTAEVAATEETVRDMEHFMQVTEELSSAPPAPARAERVR